jgi:flagellar biosynthesis/type III secretory pathway chaperone
MLGLLQHEQAALTRKAADELDEAVKAKQRLIAHLDEHTREADAILRAAGLPAGRDGIHQLLGLDPKRRLHYRWLEFMKLGEACRQQNRVNGRLVENGRRFAQQVLTLLRGESSPPDLYGRDGTSPLPGHNSRLLATS